MNGIITKYIGATNFQSSRIRATSTRGTITVPFSVAEEEGGDGRGAYAYAARQLCNKWAAEDRARGHSTVWDAPFITGGHPSGSGYLHVFTTTT